MAYDSVEVAELVDIEEVRLSFEEVRRGVGAFSRLTEGREVSRGPKAF